MNTEWKLVPSSIHELIRSGDLETLLWKLNGVHEAESVRLALYSARQSMLAESASDESLDKKEIEKWKRDSKLLEAIQDGCWDVRFLSSSNGDAGDYNIGIEIVAHFMEKPQERVIGEDWNENLRTALEQAMTAEAYPPARPAPTSHPIPTGATGGDGEAQPAINWAAVSARIAEYAEDYELYGEDDHGREGTYTPNETERGLIIDAIHGLLADDEFMDLLRPDAPAAGDALDKARLDWLEQHDGRFYNKDRISSIVGVGFLVAGDLTGMRHQSVRAAIDAAIAQQSQQKGEA